MWKKHRFLSLDKEDEFDEVASGAQFIVRYIGSTDFNELEKRTKSLIEFYCNIVQGKLQLTSTSTNSAAATTTTAATATASVAVLRLIVDLSGAVLYNQHGNICQQYQLSNISDVIYSNKLEQYQRYLVLVGQEEQENQVKAHVYVCESKKKAKELYDLFMKTFSLGTEIKCLRRQMSVNDPFLSLNDNNGAISNSTQEQLAQDKDVDINNESNVTQLCNNGEKQSGATIEEETQKNDLEESFTELALSRSKT